ncbi:MAG: N-succinyldiaminopimelate aminotransferase [Gaiellaceae bacterium]|nr:N-succinyldiaminopimelate aminotransferase [Gaiellaceae bacterium]
MTTLSPVLSSLQTYPFVRLDEAKAAARARGVELIDFGMGDPIEPTPAFIQQALVDALPLTAGYPRAPGLPELRGAIAAWLERRFGAEVDPERELIPTYGSKEAIFLFPLVACSPEKDVVVIPEPAYPVYERGAQFAGAEPRFVPLREENAWLPDLDAIDDETWERCAIFWVNYPHNPTGAVAPRAFYEELAARAREHGFYLASDEAYTELWFDEPPGSAVQLADRGNVVVFQTLSKRSSMTGYRSGFICAEPELADALRSFRPNVGTAPQEFVQRASVAAWSDEAHVEEGRALYARKRALLAPALPPLARGASVASFYLWFAVPDGETSEAFATRLLEHGVVVAPGSYFGPSGEGYARLALVPDEEACARAAEILRAAL